MLPHSTDGRRVLADEPVCHQLVFDTVAQIDREVVVCRDLVHGQLFFTQRIKVPLCIVHHEIGEILGRKCTAPLRINHKAHMTLGETVKQSICVMFQFIFEFVLVERDDLIEIDLIPIGQNTDIAAALFDLTADNQCGGERGILRVGGSGINRVPPAEPCIVLDWQSCEILQQVDRPVMLLGTLMNVPVGRQCNRKLGTLKFVLRKIIGHDHPMCPHSEGDKHIVVALLGRLDDADVQMDVGRYDLVKDICVCAEMLFDVALNGVQFFLGIDLRGHRSFLFMRRVISANFFHRGTPYVC